MYILYLWFPSTDQRRMIGEYRYLRSALKAAREFVADKIQFDSVKELKAADVPTNRRHGKTLARSLTAHLCVLRYPEEREI